MAKRLTTSTVSPLPTPGDLGRLRALVEAKQAVIADQQNMIDELADGHVEALLQSLPPSVAHLLTSLLELERSRARLDAVALDHAAEQSRLTAQAEGFARENERLRAELADVKGELERLKRQNVSYRPSPRAVGQGRPALSRTSAQAPKRRPRAA
jgi:chromosome segregation ATPase